MVCILNMALKSSVLKASCPMEEIFTYGSLRNRTIYENFAFLNSLTHWCIQIGRECPELVELWVSDYNWKQEELLWTYPGKIHGNSGLPLSLLPGHHEVSKVLSSQIVAIINLLLQFRSSSMLWTGHAQKLVKPWDKLNLSSVQGFVCVTDSLSK